jgi:hypothetical protein
MEKSRIDQILQYGRVAAVPVFLFYKNSIKALNEQAESIGLTKEELISFPKEKDVVTGWMLETGDGETEQFYKIYARHILLEDGDCWLIETIREDNQMKLLEISRISKARKIMFEMSSKIDSIETNHDIYDFILDNCGKAVEYSDMCSLMRIDNGMAHVVAKRGYSDAIYQMYIQKNETFIGLETNGKLDHSIMINDLEKYYTFYNRDVLAEERGFSLKSTKFSGLKSLNFINTTAKASLITSVAVVELIGAIPIGHASFSTPIFIIKSALTPNFDFSLPVNATTLLQFFL